MITKRQFDILVFMKERRRVVSQRDLSEEVNSSLGSVNKALKSLESMGLVENSLITEKGEYVLSEYKVKRAVFIAAGLGSRLVPITLNTPKPLIRIRGERIIDKLLDAVLEAEIEEIYIVRGYLSEQFDQLLYKYPMIKFIENPYFNEENNISSAMYAREIFKEAYVFDADLLLYNKSLITKYQYSSNYLGIYVDETDDWCFKNKGDKITGVSIGGRDCYQMIGVSYWTKKDGEKFSRHIREVYNSPGGKERFWDQVVLEYYLDEYDIRIRECMKEDIVEIDTFRELKEIDKTYDI